jgi:hypothetical protein
VPFLWSKPAGDVSAPYVSVLSEAGRSIKTLEPDATLNSRKEIVMDLLFLTAVHHASATVTQARPMWTPKSEIAADVITGLLTLGVGIFIFRLPPERRKPTRG